MPQFRPLPGYEPIEERRQTAEAVVEEGMPQFRPLPSFGKIAERGRTEELLDSGLRENTEDLPFLAQSTTGQMRVVLLRGPDGTSVTEQLAALANKPSAIDQHSSLTAALKATMGTNGFTSRLTVIPADTRRQTRKLDQDTKKVRRLKLHTRQAIVLLATLTILIGTLASLVPLASDQGSGGFLGGFGDLIHSAQLGWQIQAHQNMAQAASSSSSTIPVNGDLPPMTIPNSQYVAVAQQAALSAGIPEIYFVRQINQESGFNPDAVSVTDAEGIAQFEPSTAAGLGIDPWNPVQALYGAAQLMANYYHIYGDYAKALSAYNAGSANLQAAENACGINWLGCLPGQTQNYVYVIMGV
jgi:hypothetical protein